MNLFNQFFAFFKIVIIHIFIYLFHLDQTILIFIQVSFFTIIILSIFILVWLINLDCFTSKISCALMKKIYELTMVFLFSIHFCFILITSMRLRLIMLAIALTSLFFILYAHLYLNYHFEHSQFNLIFWFGCHFLS